MNALEILSRQFEKGSGVHAYLFLTNDKERTDELVAYVAEKIGSSQYDISRVVPEDLSGKAGEIKKESIDQLIKDISLTPGSGARLVLIYNAEKLNAAAANHLLKVLEEPPGKTVFILMAESDNVIATIKSRCQIIKMPFLPPSKRMEVAEILAKGFYDFSLESSKIVEESRTEEFLEGLEAYFRKKLLEHDQSAVLKLKQVNKTKKAIAGNANARLALEALILKVK